MDDEIIRRIREAFPNGKPPQRPLTGHRCDECDQTDFLLGDRTWSDVAADFPGFCHDTFPLLKDEAQRYYLPAYMIASLAPDACMQATSVACALRGDYFQPAGFTNAQLRAIAEWLQANPGDADDELISKWASEE